MVLRILFRDDDGFKLSCMNSRGVALYCVRNTLLNGLSVGGKMYTMIGSSCSQLRDNGCYFVQGCQIYMLDFFYHLTFRHRGRCRRASEVNGKI